MISAALKTLAYLESPLPSIGKLPDVARGIAQPAVPIQITSFAGDEDSRELVDKKRSP